MVRRRDPNRREAEVDSVSKWHITLRIPVGYAELVPTDAQDEGRKEGRRVGKQKEEEAETDLM